MTRTIVTGLLATCCIAAAGVGLWLNAVRTGNDLASVLPADAVLAYVHAPHEDILRTMVPLFAPSLPAVPEITSQVSAAAAVRLPNGTEGWIIRTVNEFGAIQFAGSDPALEALINAPGTSLARDHAFRTIRWHDDASWIYIAFPHASSNGSPFESILALDSPLSSRLTGSGITLRHTADLPYGIAPWPLNPRKIPSHGEHVLLIPAWQDMHRLAPLLSVTTLDIIETLSRTFFDSYVHGLSMHYDGAPLFDHPSILVLDTNSSGSTVVTWEGRGRAPSDTNRVLRAMHSRFEAGHGGARVQTIEVEGFTLRTIAHESEVETNEYTAGEWTILTTSTPAGILHSEHNGARFVITTTPTTLPLTEGTGPALDSTIITWNDAASSRISPLWPSLQPTGPVLRSILKGGPGYVEWTLEPVQSF